MIGRRPNTTRKIKQKRGEGLVKVARFGYLSSKNSPAFKVSLGNIRSAHDKHGDTWERKKGEKCATRVRKKRGAIKTIIVPESRDNEREYMDALDYGDMWKMVIGTPRIYEKDEIRVEFIEKGRGHIQVTAPGFNRALPLLALKSFDGNVDWNYKNGVLEVNQWK